MDMDAVKFGLKRQYRAQLEMLRDCIEMCPDDLWSAGQHPRAFWRIAYHTLYYTHLYLMQNGEDFQPRADHVSHARVLWDDDEDGMPPVETTYTKAQMLDYRDQMAQNVDNWVDSLDLESQESGIAWYKMPKFEHQLVNLRHLAIHIGQMQERLYPVGAEPRWVSKA